MVSNIGFFEILVLAGIALIIMGPDKFPGFAKVVIKTFRDLRGYVTDVKQELTKELKPVDDEIRRLKHYRAEDYIDALTAQNEVPDNVGNTSENKKNEIHGDASTTASQKDTISTPPPDPYANIDERPISPSEDDSEPIEKGTDTADDADEPYTKPGTTTVDYDD